MKICKKCGEEKADAEFMGKNSLRITCHDCVRRKKEHLAETTRYEELKRDLIELHNQHRPKACEFVIKLFKNELGLDVAIVDNKIQISAP